MTIQENVAEMFVYDTTIDEGLVDEGWLVFVTDANTRIKQAVETAFMHSTVHGFEYWANEVETLAKEKGWNASDWRWLTTGMFVEAGEMVNSVLHKESQDKIAHEFADLMHYALQFAKLVCPDYDLDKAMKEVIDNNRATKKKTTDDVGNVVMK